MKLTVQTRYDWVFGCALMVALHFAGSFITEQEMNVLFSHCTWDFTTV